MNFLKLILLSSLSINFIQASEHESEKFVNYKGKIIACDDLAKFLISKAKEADEEHSGRVNYNQRYSKGVKDPKNLKKKLIAIQQVWKASSILCY